MTDPIRAALEQLHQYAEMYPEHDTDGIVAAARAALAVPELEGPADEELEALADQFWVENSVNFEAEHYAFARAVLARWGRPAPAPAGERQAAPVPVAADVYFEFAVSDADYCTQAGGIAPTYAQALDEGQRYLAQYQQDGVHTLELRRVEVLPIPQQGVE